MLKEIVNIINKGVKAKFSVSKDFESAKFYGIAIQMQKPGKGQQFPVYVDGDGKTHFVGFDDIHSLVLYHKNNGINYIPTQNRQFGNTQDNLTMKANMSMIVIAKRDSVANLQPEDLDVLIVSGTPTILTPDQLAGLNLQQGFITHVASSFDYISIFKREFINAGAGLTIPDLEMVEIKYTIECQFNRNCINILPNC